ncbi:molybdopterin molybdotransferase MoeA [Sediminibacterium sp. KACHI17]|uniref:Molybdopterin molybdenumtransferase n=1 Tax=Sediminibacterium sp. KACHI17 TaxID=1751071 RepID=A0AAT9GFK2_9BACT
MISVSEARSIIQKYISALPAKPMMLHEALGFFIAADIFSTVDIPAYPQSSMDGYAFSFEDWKRLTALSVHGEMAAGSQNAQSLIAETAVRIFTGAAVPEGADTVVMQEKTKVENGQLNITDEQLQQGANVRLKGSEIKAGELALPAGTLLTPAAIGFLAGIGITEVMVYPSPSVSIIITGNELQKPGHSLKYGQVYDANSFSLSAALRQCGVDQIRIIQVPDVIERLNEALSDALQQSDLVLLTGGVSVGDYDFVLQSAQHCGITTRFHKLKQRPGKPLFFGTKEHQLIFGLPGNPSSVLTCFYMYVLPVIHGLKGKPHVLKKQQVPIAQTYQKNTQLTHFLKGWYDGNNATPLGAQESYRMRSFAEANCLIEIDEQVTKLNEGDLVTIHLLSN